VNQFAYQDWCTRYTAEGDTHCNHRLGEAPPDLQGGTGRLSTLPDHDFQRLLEEAKRQPYHPYDPRLSALLHEYKNRRDKQDSDAPPI
jgi:hypothetical protein